MINQIQALSDYTIVSKFSKYLPEKKRRETWDECVQRSKDFYYDLYPDEEIRKDIDFAFDAYKEKLVFGANRVLQFAGDALKKKHARAYNCWYSPCDRTRFFQEAMYILLAGGGIGYSVQKHHIDNLPEIKSPNNNNTKTFVIPDSIEGWADAIGILLSSYFVSHQTFEDYTNSVIHFDYSQIRPEGSSFSHGIGKAPGYKPLEKTLEMIRALLNNSIKNNQFKLKSIDVYDIVCHISDAVLSGGIRRSSTICLFDIDDHDMLSAKTGNWYQNNPQRARSNNSAIAVRHQVTKEQYSKLILMSREWGDPGTIWVNNNNHGVNPCCEIMFFPYDEQGISGWQACNLSTQNGSKIKNKKDWERAIKAATILGTLQASLTSFPYLGKTTESIVKREALLGVSITGMMHNVDLLLNPDIQREMAELAKKINKEMAAKLKINPAARITTIKPEGTISCMAGTSSGIHPAHSKRFIRRVQANKLENLAKYYGEINPKAIEKSVWSANGTDIMISFACELDDKVITKDKISAIDFLNIVKSTQLNYIHSGKSIELCTDPTLNHNVSNTVVVKNHEWSDVENFIFDNQDYFTGVSLLSFTGDKDFEQAPFTAVFTPEEIVQKYGEGSLFTSGLINEALELFNGRLWIACNEALSDGANIKEKLANEHEESIRQQKIVWINKLKKFAKNYLDNNLLNTTYLLKDVYNWKTWLDLKNNVKKVDYTECIEHENQTIGNKEIACSGGVCELI